MRFRIDTASGDTPPSRRAEKVVESGDVHWEIEIADLGDLLELIKEHRAAIVVDSTSITIYDDYLE